MNDRGMPVGKFRGQPLTELPDWYLSWLRRIELYEPLLSAVDAEWRRRLEQESSHPRALPADLTPVASQLVSAGLRELTRRHHPDLGGEGVAMARVNAAAAWLRAIINGAA
jgi:hypothetical protein